MDGLAGDAPAGLAIRGLHVAVDGTVVLDHVDLDVRPGEVAVLAGRSGAGKTTLARAVVGVLDPAHSVQGEVRVAGEVLWATGRRPRRDLLGRSIALVPADPRAALHPAHRVEWLVAEPLVVRGGLDRAAARRRARELLAEVGLEGDVLPLLPQELSGGMCQRVLIARTLALEPPVLVADEPTSALDERARAEVTDLLVARVRSRGGALLVITHHLEDVVAAADHVHELDRGRLRPAAPTPSSPGPGPAAAPTESVLVSLRGVRVERPGRGRGRVLVDGLDLDVAAGEAVAVVGPSGVGKTTLLRTLVGLAPVAAGRIEVLGSPLADLPPRHLRRLRRHVRLVHQDPTGALDPRWPVLRSVREPLDVHGLGTAAARDDRALAALDEVGLGPDLARRRPGELSTGQRQRAVLARALVSEPRVLLADEPTAALDGSTEADVLALLERWRDDGLALVVTSHHRRVVARLAHRVVPLGSPEGQA